MAREIRQGFEDKTLAQVKAVRIAESKSKLESWLAAHPYQSDVKGGEMRSYSVTREKQVLLTNELTLAQGTSIARTQYIPKWNATGQPSEDWTLEELMTLAYGIAEYVKPYVAYQQAAEVKINKCRAVSTVEAVEIDYSEV